MKRERNKSVLLCAKTCNTVFFALDLGQVLGQTIKNGLADSLQTRESPGADNQIRTDDLRFTKALLYQLSYTGKLDTLILPSASEKVNLTKINLLASSFGQPVRPNHSSYQYH